MRAAIVSDEEWEEMAGRYEWRGRQRGWHRRGRGVAGDIVI